MRPGDKTTLRFKPHARLYTQPLVADGQGRDVTKWWEGYFELTVFAGVIVACVAIYFWVTN